MKNYAKIIEQTWLKEHWLAFMQDQSYLMGTEMWAVNKKINARKNLEKYPKHEHEWYKNHTIKTYWQFWNLSRYLGAATTADIEVESAGWTSCSWNMNNAGTTNLCW